MNSPSSEDVTELMLVESSGILPREGDLELVFRDGEESLREAFLLQTEDSLEKRRQLRFSNRLPFGNVSEHFEKTVSRVSVDTFVCMADVRQ